MRPSDAFRRRTVTALGNDYVVGRMGEDTFERRLDRAFAARSRVELRGLRADVSPVAALLDELRRHWRALIAQPGCAAIEVRLPATIADRPLVIGRARSCDHVVDHETVSRRHAELARDGSRWLLRDLSSTNGTWDGDWRVTETEIDAGSELRLGGVLVRFRA